MDSGPKSIFGILVFSEFSCGCSESLFWKPGGHQIIDFLNPGFSLAYVLLVFQRSGFLGHATRTQSTPKSARIYFGPI